MPPPTWQDRLNKLYLTFFLIHIPIMFALDLTPLYPPSLRPALLTRIRSWYVDVYKDRFFTDEAPVWFRWFLCMEAGGHVPVSAWAVWRLLEGRGGDSPILHLNLLVFALQTALTTAVCIVEYRSWPELSSSEKSTLGGLYIPYFVFAVVMGVDMYMRVRSRLEGIEQVSIGKKKS